MFTWVRSEECLMDESRYRNILEAEPGDPVFAEYAERLRASGRHGEAIEICLRGLSSNPSCHGGRLVLARTFYEKGYHPFAQREVEQLARDLPDSRTVQQLRARLCGGASQNETREERVAEAEFDIDELELIEKKEKE
jgi:predicted Zn-dependent protease